MWVWLLTLLKGFLPTTGQRVGKILWVSGICIACLFVWNRLVEPKTKIERIETQIINQCPKDDSVGLKLNLWKFYIKLGV